METLQFMRNNRGLTLIEVMIALAIISIALTAIIKATAQNIKDTQYLQNKTIAGWVGSEVMSKIQLGLIPLPLSEEPMEEETRMLNHDWLWQGHLENTPNSHIKKIVVIVLQKNSAQKYIQLTGYLYG